MDDPKSQIAPLIHTLCSGAPSAQQQALEAYFTPDASFSHPLCSVPSFSSVGLPVVGEVNSRWVLGCVYKWYKVLSPRVVVGVDGVEYNPETQTLFLQLHQQFHLFFVPFFYPTVYLTTILYLARAKDSSEDKYLVKHQEDLYQSAELVKFFWPGGTQIISFWRWIATLFCILGAMAFAPVTWMEEWGWFGNGKDVKRGEKEDGEERETGGCETNRVNDSRREKRRKTINGSGRKN
ncbi:uncharacterized protein EAF01_009021 [Botrytis porri]|uniref:uncharacterized protein n=1 Tax=Botrytis porri TaxID=87229 RepID=UPI0018FFA6EA|nr:uncharacterized protein EAF01_009021 [Botrytis porri]KAF7896618.1 hypothetical protein EAF01_009021 [Botrytis porri]